MYKSIGIVDSGFATHQQAWIFTSQRFVLTSVGVSRQACIADPTGHGSAILDVIHSHQHHSRFAIAQVFDERGRTSVKQVVAAIDWLIEQPVELINLSLGLRHHNEELQAACQRAKNKGILLMASSPAMGEPVYPAAYPEVISITGDGRCKKPDQYTHLTQGNAKFGAYVQGPAPHAGASMACAHFVGIWARNTLEPLSKEALL